MLKFSPGADTTATGKERAGSSSVLSESCRVFFLSLFSTSESLRVRKWWTGRLPHLSPPPPLPGPCGVSRSRRHHRTCPTKRSKGIVLAFCQSEHAPEIFTFATSVGHAPSARAFLPPPAETLPRYFLPATPLSPRVSFSPSV